jgi:hypothetical protein
MNEHVVSIIVLIDGRYRAVCVCGFKGRRVQPEQRHVAEAQAEQHLSYHAEVATLTAPRED